MRGQRSAVPVKDPQKDRCRANRKGLFPAQRESFMKKFNLQPLVQSLQLASADHG